MVWIPTAASDMSAAGTGSSAGPFASGSIGAVAPSLIAASRLSSVSGSAPDALASGAHAIAALGSAAAAAPPAAPPSPKPSTCAHMSVATAFTSSSEIVSST